MGNGRAHRRRAQRARVQPILVGENMVATPLPAWYHAVPGATLPAKEAGRHRWVAFAAFTLTAAQAAGAYGEGPNFLSHESLFELGIACWDCEQPLGPDTPAGGFCTRAGKD